MYSENTETKMDKNEEHCGVEKRNETYIEYDLNIDNFLYRSSIIKNTSYIYGIVLYTGKYTKVFQNILVKKYKISTLEKYYNKHFIFLAILQMALCGLASILYFLQVYTTLDKHWYINIQAKQSVIELMKIFFTSVGKFLLLLSYFIPLTTVLLLEVSRNRQAQIMNNDTNILSKNGKRRKQEKQENRSVSTFMDRKEKNTYSTQVTESSEIGWGTAFPNKTQNASIIKQKTHYSADYYNGDSSLQKKGSDGTVDSSKRFVLSNNNSMESRFPFCVNECNRIQSSIFKEDSTNVFPRKHHSFPPMRSPENISSFYESDNLEKMPTLYEKYKNRNDSETGRIRKGGSDNESESHSSTDEKNLTSSSFVKHYSKMMKVKKYNKQHSRGDVRNYHDMDGKYHIRKQYRIKNSENNGIINSLYVNSISFSRRFFRNSKSLFSKRRSYTMGRKGNSRYKTKWICRGQQKWINEKYMYNQKNIFTKEQNIFNNMYDGEVRNTENVLNTSRELQISMLKEKSEIGKSDICKKKYFKGEKNDVKKEFTMNSNTGETDNTIYEKDSVDVRIKVLGGKGKRHIQIDRERDRGRDRDRDTVSEKSDKHIQLEEENIYKCKKYSGQLTNHICQSKNMIEELGCVTHLFTDKTGTLTNNKLHFECVAVYNKLFGLNKKKKRKKKGKRAFNTLHFLFHLEVSNKKYRKNAREFFYCLSLCHSVLIRKKENSDNPLNKEYVNFFPKSYHKGKVHSLQNEQKQTQGNEKEDQEETGTVAETGTGTGYCLNGLTDIHCFNSVKCAENEEEKKGQVEKYGNDVETCSITELNKYFNNIFKLYEAHEHLNVDLEIMQKIYDSQFWEHMKTYVQHYKDKKVTLPVVVLCKKEKKKYKSELNIKSQTESVTESTGVLEHDSWHSNETNDNNYSSDEEDEHCKMYDVSSPDERALLKAANTMGIKFIGRSNIKSIDFALTNKTLVNLLLSNTDKMYLNDLMCHIVNVLKRDSSNHFEKDATGKNEKREKNREKKRKKKRSCSSRNNNCEQNRNIKQKEDKNGNKCFEKKKRSVSHEKYKHYSNFFSKVKLNFIKKEIHPEELKITALNKYDILVHINVDVVDIFPFNYIQKYMYVVVKERHENLLKFYVKGADEAIYKLAKNNKTKKTFSKYLQLIAIQGYRTLVFSYIPTKEKTYYELKEKYKGEKANRRGAIGFFLEDLNMYLNEIDGTDENQSSEYIGGSPRNKQNKEMVLMNVQKNGYDEPNGKTQKMEEAKSDGYKKNAFSEVDKNEEKEVLSRNDKEINGKEINGKKINGREISGKEIGNANIKTSPSDENKKKKHLRIVACTGVHDQLQKYVKKTIKKIKDANIKICMLTGDKIETAISVAYNCSILNTNTYNHIIISNDSNTILNQMFQYFTYLYASDVAKNKISSFQEHKKNKRIRKTTNETNKSKNGKKTDGEEMGHIIDDKKEGSKKEKTIKKKSAKREQHEEDRSSQPTDLEKSDKRDESVTMATHDFSHTECQKELKTQRKMNWSTINKKKKKKKKKKRTLRPTFTLYKFLNIIASKTNKKNKYEKDNDLSYLELKNIIQQYLEERIVENENEDFHHAIEKKKLEVFKNSCLTINGEVLDIISQNNRLKNLFISIIKFVDYIIIGRCTPKNKSDIVQLFNSMSSRNVTLAIGDGSNDVSMLVTANIGVAIYNDENTQAVKAGDFVISEFQQLQYLLLCHGGEALRKNSVLVYHTICKNIMFGSADFFFAFLSNFSGTDIFNPYLKQMYNLFFTTFPILAYVFHDLQLPYHVLLSTPQLYTNNSSNRASKYMSQRLLVLAILYGLYVAFLVIFLTAHILTHLPIYNNFLIFLNLYGHIVYFVFIIVVNLVVVLASTVFSKVLLLFVFLSISLFCFMTYVCQYLECCKDVANFIYLFKIPVFHYYLSAILFVNLFPLICYKMYISLIRPRIPQIIRERIYKGVCDIVLAPQNMNNTDKSSFINFLEIHEKNPLKTRKNKNNKYTLNNDTNDPINENFHLAVIVPKCAKKYTGYAFTENDKNRWRYLHIRQSSK